MSDNAHRITDELLSEMEARLAEIYREAQAGIEKKAQAYFDKFAELDRQKRKMVALEELTHSEYLQWRQNKIMYGKRWSHLKKQIAAELANVNRTALAYINGRIPEIYALNYNASGEGIAGEVRGYSFELVDTQTVKNLALNDETLLPYKYLDGVKDVRWNTKKVNAAVLQGILQGESIPKMARRLQRVTEMNRASAIRNARTSVTSAECKGRQDSYEKATKDGIELKREWISTFDNRTRHSHVLLDGQLADVDKPFKSELGTIMYPGDPEADPANVYGCRCTVAAKVISIGGVKIDEHNQEYDNRRTVSDFYNEDPKEFDIRQKMLYNKKADTAQFAAYKARLGAEAPKRLADWQNLKYRDAEKYANIKAFYRYKGRVPEATMDDFKIAQNIKAKGIVGTVRVPAAKIDISNISAVNEHAFRHGCTLEDAKKYIKNAKVSIVRSRWDGLSQNFYAMDGAVYVDYTTKNAKTIFGKKDFDPETKSMMEEFE